MARAKAQLLVNDAQPPDVWSPTARDSIVGGEAAVRALAGSLATDRLVRKIQRYAQGELSGYSVLVAGHRGAGKTTAVLAAMQIVHNEYRNRGSSRRPLLVRIHGPSLLLPRQISEANAKAKAETERAKAQADAAKASAEVARMQAVAARARKEGQEQAQAEAKAGGQGLAGAALMAAGGGHVPAVNRDISGVPVAEDPAQHYSLRILQEMAAGIFPALLDELRRTLEARHRGDLSTGEAMEHGSAESRGVGTHDPSRDAAARTAESREMVAHLVDELSRGMSLRELREMYRLLGLMTDDVQGRDAAKELVAINAAGETYLIVTGKLDTVKGSGATQDDTSIRVASARWTGQSATDAISKISLALVASAGLAFNDSIGAILAVLTVFIGGVALMTTRTQTRTASGSATRTFIRDNSLESLVRRVPLLVDQLREIGFAPVFVVDELDKIEDPPVDQLLDALLRHLKSYVTERSFICFVADRAYYRSITMRDEGGRYGAAHTFYRDRVYVVSSPQELHEYMRRVLGEDELDGQARRNATFLRHALLHRARMHPYDVRIQIERASDNGELEQMLSVSSANVQTPVATYEVFLQLCFEWILADTDQQREILIDPYYMQILYDALFQVSDNWKQRAPLRPVTDRREQSPGDETLATVEDAWINARTTDSGQRELVRQALRQLTEYLRRPAALVQDAPTDLDEDRLRRFFLDGELEVDDARAADALAEFSVDLVHGRDAGVLGGALASYKLELLRLVVGVEVATDATNVGEGLMALIEPDQEDYRPQVDPRGFPLNGSRVGSGEHQRLQRLDELRALPVISRIGFEIMWDAVAQGFPFSDLQNARQELASPLPFGSPRVVTRYAEIIPVVEEAILALLVGVHVVARMRGEEPSSSHVEPLLRAVRGTTLAGRRDSARDVAPRLSVLLGLKLSALSRELLSASYGSVVLDRLDDADFVTGEVTVREQARTDWQESLAERIIRRIESEAIGPELGRRGALLDVAASVEDWFPPRLRVWLDWPEPAEWTVKIWSHVLADGDDRTAPFRALAASMLGTQHLLAQELDNAPGSVQGWARRKLDELRRNPPPVVILLNPGEVMSKWIPVPGIAARVLDATLMNDELIKKLGPAHVVFQESDALRPEGLTRVQYVAIEAGGDAAEAMRWLRDGTLMLSGPRTLGDALRLHQRGFELDR